MTCSYYPTIKWTKVHQIKLNQKQDNFTQEDIIEFAKKCNLSKKQAMKILDKTIEVFKGFGKYANELKEIVLKNLRTLSSLYYFSS